MSQTIDITHGAIEYTLPLTIIEKNGKNISAATLVISLGTEQDPGDWVTPDTDPVQTDHSHRVVQMLIGDAVKPLLGEYWLWSFITDDPEQVPRRHQRIVIA